MKFITGAFGLLILAAAFYAGMTIPPLISPNDYLPSLDGKFDQLIWNKFQDGCQLKNKIKSEKHGFLFDQLKDEIHILALYEDVENNLIIYLLENTKIIYTAGEKVVECQ